VDSRRDQAIGLGRGLPPRVMLGVAAYDPGCIGRAIYRQIVEQLWRPIAGGRLPSDERLPPVRDVGCSR